MSPLVPRSIAVLAACQSLACGSRAPQAPVTPPPAPFEVTVCTSSETNDRRALVLLIRAVPKTRFFDEEYDSIADLAVAPDDSVLAQAVLVPSEVRKFSVRPAPKGELALYFLFSKPADESWRWLVPERVTAPVLVLGRFGIESTTSVATVKPQK